ncbi:benzoate 4-monooxygenase cytochrome p450 [Colletotrichum tofieldiae]|uniref:Benzoate 4-monooxygenase cytochrome p450 n=1 Tax=Colletotrichum tofieldiae TaxID=708197 RepID=A0A166ME01_9PEZI|nr:benzoate 4-monooxygenase cytochrome p450 [Colletotrichum tofieldiae]
MPETEAFWLTTEMLDFEDQSNVSSNFPWTLSWSAQHAADHTDLQGPDRRQALPRRRSRYRFTQSDYRAVPIPVLVPLSTEGLDPMQRWRKSPPQDEPASIAAIRDALKKDSARAEGNGGGASPEYGRTNSWGSMDSGGSSSSIQSASSVWSATSNASRGQYSSLDRTRQGKTGKNRVSASQKNAKDIRPFKCTFCCDSFKTKYDWARHEKSRHLNPESWVCAPHGGSIMSTATGHFHCVYCSVVNPSDEHLESHSHSLCHDRPIEARSFGRKDHLVQHLRVMHKLEKMP